MIGVPLIGCYGHRLNLAVRKYLEPKEPLLENVNKLMIKLSGLKHAAELRKNADLRSNRRQQTRWCSTSAMLSRYQELKHHLDPTDLQTASFLPNATENIVFANLTNHWDEKTGVGLQEASGGECRFITCQNSF